MFVIVSTYQNLSVDRVTSGAEPTFIGPLFIHGKSSTKTYNVFSTIASRLQYANFHELRVGSDDEYALRKLIQFCFPGSIHVACRQRRALRTERGRDEPTAAEQLHPGCVW